MTDTPTNQSLQSNTIEAQNDTDVSDNIQTEAPNESDTAVDIPIIIVGSEDEKTKKINTLPLALIIIASVLVIAAGVTIAILLASDGKSDYRNTDVTPSDSITASSNTDIPETASQPDRPSPDIGNNSAPLITFPEPASYSSVAEKHLFVLKDKQLDVFYEGNPEPIGQIDEISASRIAVCSPGGQAVIASASKLYYLSDDMLTPFEIEGFSYKSNQIFGLSNSGDTLVCTNGDNQLVIYSVADQSTILLGQKVKAAVISKNGRSVLYSSLSTDDKKDKTYELYVYSDNTSYLVEGTADHFPLAVSDDGKTLWTSDKQGSLRLISNGKQSKLADSSKGVLFNISGTEALYFTEGECRLTDASGNTAILFKCDSQDRFLAILPGGTVPSNDSFIGRVYSSGDGLYYIRNDLKKVLIEKKGFVSPTVTYNGKTLYYILNGTLMSIDLTALEADIIPSVEPTLIAGKVKDFKLSNSGDVYYMSSDDDGILYTKSGADVMSSVHRYEITDDGTLVLMVDYGDRGYKNAGCIKLYKDGAFCETLGDVYYNFGTGDGFIYAETYISNAKNDDLIISDGVGEYTKISTEFDKYGTNLADVLAK